ADLEEKANEKDSNAPESNEMNSGTATCVSGSSLPYAVKRSGAVQMKDVAVRVLEPGHPESVRVVDSVLVRHAIHLIVLERHTPGAQVGNDSVDICSAVPHHGIGLVRAGKFRRIDDEISRTRVVDQHAVHALVVEFKPEHITVKMPSSIDVAHCDNGRG